MGFVELRKRVEDLYKAHEQELEEVLCLIATYMFWLLQHDSTSFSCVCNGWHYFLTFQFQANKILRQKIAEDQFLDLVSVETEVRSVYKELYRWAHAISLN